MCWNEHVSLNTFLFSSFVLLLIIYTFGHLKWDKNPKIKNQKCKINSRSFTYDGLTFSTSSLVLEVVKDEI